MRRIVIIDILRFIAIVAMILFHIAYDLATFYHYLLDYERGFWKFLQVVLAGGLFIFVSGWTAVLGRRNLKNLMKIAVCALLITIVTRYQFGSMYVRFGVLHFILVANLIYLTVLHRFNNCFLSILAVVVMYLSKHVHKLYVEHEYLVWLDIAPIEYQSVDHYPLLPWLGVFIAGIICGRCKNIQILSNTTIEFIGLDFIKKCSKHSLAIYILHQPIILLLLLIYHH